MDDVHEMDADLSQIEDNEAEISQLGDNAAELSQLSETEAESSQVHDNTEHQITEALTQLPFVSDVSIDYRPCDKDEDHIVSRFMSAGCGCARKCHLNFSTEYVSNFRLHCLELTTPELDLAVLGQISAFTNTSSNVSDTSHAASIRKHSYSTYYHQSRQVCSSMFGFTVGKNA